MLALATAGPPALAAFVAFVLTVGTVRRYPVAGLCLAALVIVPLWEFRLGTPLVTIAGVSVTASDVITLILFVVGLLEFKQLRTNLQGWWLPWLLLGVLIALALLRGISIYGLTYAVNEARGELWFYFAMTWALAVRPDRLKLETVSVVLGWMLVLVALYHAVKLGGLGSPTARAVVEFRLDGSGVRIPNRILVASQAFALLLCAGILFLRTADSVRSRKRLVGSSLIFLGVVLVSQHRSVWTAALVATTAVLIFVKGRHARGGARSKTFGLFAGGAWLVLIAWTLRSGGNPAIDSAIDRGTLGWRSAGWQILVSDAIAHGPVTVVTGEPFGSGFLRTIGNSTIGVQPHNWYVSIFLRLGIIGLILFAGILLAALSKSRARSAEWMFVLVAVGVYAFFYSVDWFMAPWLAAAMVVSLRGGGVADEVLEPSPPKGASAFRVGASAGTGRKERKNMAS